LTEELRHGTLRAETKKEGNMMAEAKSSVGEVRVKPDRLHAFTMAICQADGSSPDEAKLVADQLVLANLFGHDSHGVGMMPAYITNTQNGACVRNHHATIARDNGSVIVVDGGHGYGQVVAKEAMDIGIERARKNGVCVVGLTNAHHIGRIGHWAEQCARAGMVSTHWVNVHGHKSLVAPFGGAEPRFSTNPYCTAVPRKGKEPIVLDFATSQVAMGKVRVANNKKIQMEPGLLIDSQGNQTTEPGVMYNVPYGAILPFGLHKGGGLAVICDLLAGALTGGGTHSPRTIVKDGTDIVNNMLSIIIDPASMGGTAYFEDEVENFVGWVKSAKPQPGVDEVLTPGEPERARKLDREKNGVPIDNTTWQQLIEVARKVRLNDTDIPVTAG
jgi:hydroxycarboxylate dehydrogenase B